MFLCFLLLPRCLGQLSGLLGPAAKRSKSSEQAAMDPTPAEVRAMGNIADAVAWVGMRPGVFAGLTEALGEFNLFREIVAVPIGSWDAAVMTLRVITQLALPEVPEILPVAAVPGISVEIRGAPKVAAIPRIDRAPGAIEIGQVGVFRRVCRLRMRRPADEEQVGAAAPPPPPPGVQGPAGRTLAMREHADQVDDSRIPAWPVQQHTDCMAVHQAANGGEPAPKEDTPTVDMLASLDYRVRTVESPWVDFALWRPYGKRMQREWKMMSQQINAAGEYVPYIIAGPPDYDAWLNAWRVFSVAMIALNLATPFRLDLYARCIARLAKLVGVGYWWFLAIAEDRMRQEEIPRLMVAGRREQAAAAAQGQPHEFDVAVP